MPEVEQQEQKTTVPVGEASYQDYKDARSKGLTAIPAEADPEKDEPEEKPPVKAAKAEETEPDSETGDEDEPKKSKGGGFQRRIDKLTRHAKELEAELERVKASNPVLPGKLVETGEKPSVNDVGTKYKTYEDYIEALADWKAESKRAEWQAKDQQEAEAAHNKSVFDAHQERLVEAKEKYPDFEEVVTNADIPIPQGVELAVVKMKNGPEVAYYLGKHPEICKELCELGDEDALLAIAEVGAIAKELRGSEGRPAKKLESKTEKPIVPVGKSSTKSSVPLSEMSQADYNKARQAGRTA